MKYITFPSHFLVLPQSVTQFGSAQSVCTGHFQTHTINLILNVGNYLLTFRFLLAFKFKNIHIPIRLTVKTQCNPTYQH